MRSLLTTLLLFVAILCLLNAIPLFFSRTYIHETPQTLAEADIGLVLGAGLTPEGIPGPILQDRLNTALKLYRAKKIEKILLSGDGVSQWYNEVRAMRKYLLERGVDSVHLLTDPQGISTLQSMHNARRWTGHSIIILTQRFHLYRAVFVARQMNLQAVGLVSDEHTSPLLARCWNQWRELWARPLAVYKMLSLKLLHQLECSL